MFLEIFKSDQEAQSECQYQVLNNLFYYVDAFVANPELRDKGDVDDDMLKARAREALNKLT